jgi:predicted methyltransferase
MRAFAAAAAVSLAALSACTTNGDMPAGHAISSQDTDAALADPARSAEMRALDESRKPRETLAFLGLQPGMDAADIFTGGGYWAEIMARLVAPEGSVTAYEPTQFYKGDGKTKLDALIAASPASTVKAFPFEGFTAPAGAFDFAMINLNYHDLYWESAKYGIGRSDPAAFTRNLYAAMRPGGIVGVIDHVGPAGDTRAIVEKSHRIDPATVRADFERAGFKLEAQSDLLANPGDDHSKGVFDPAIRGKTDRFLYKFRKPRR